MCRCSTLCFSVFFFKQKTAYEMRISDWSSDVCSSDLIMSDAAHVILCKPSREFSGNFCIDDVVLHETGVRDFSKYAAVPGTPESKLEIGRASWRERVCQ